MLIDALITSKGFSFVSFDLIILNQTIEEIGMCINEEPKFEL